MNTIYNFYVTIRTKEADTYVVLVLKNNVKISLKHLDRCHDKRSPTVQIIK